MSKWTHRICDACWVKLRGEREPTRLLSAEPEPCCFCGEPAESKDGGIYVREDGTKLACRGECDNG